MQKKMCVVQHGNMSFFMFHKATDNMVSPITRSFSSRTDVNFLDSYIHRTDDFIFQRLQNIRSKQIVSDCLFV